MANKRKNNLPVLKDSDSETTKSSTLATQVKITFIAEKMVKEGWSRFDVMKLLKEDWGYSNSQAERYYKAACETILPSNDQKWRDALIARNLGTLEEIIKRALDGNNLKAATEAIKALNNMLGVGGKQVEIKDGEGATQRTITISFE